MSDARDAMAIYTAIGRGRLSVEDFELAWRLRPDVRRADIETREKAAVRRVLVDGVRVEEACDKYAEFDKVFEESGEYLSKDGLRKSVKDTYSQLFTTVAASRYEFAGR